MRKQSYSVTLRNEYILKRIKDIKADHPFWGYRRVWAYLRYIDGLIVNKKVYTG
ncbi:MAG: transposase [Thermodesulfobacteriales bacterium]|jgi:putative transposase|nr:MAG: transposase [Thermodesulfobacteriales bacterium]